MITKRNGARNKFLPAAILVNYQLSLNVSSYLLCMWFNYMFSPVRNDIRQAVIYRSTNLMNSIRSQK